MIFFVNANVSKETQAMILILFKSFSRFFHHLYGLYWLNLCDALLKLKHIVFKGNSAVTFLILQYRIVPFFNTLSHKTYDSI